MKRFGLNAVIVACLIFGLCFLTGCDKEVHRKIMPPDYELQSNSIGEYRWKSQTHTQRVATDKQEAIDMAWTDHEQGAFHTVDMP